MPEMPVNLEILHLRTTKKTLHRSIAVGTSFGGTRLSNTKLSQFITVFVAKSIYVAH